MGAQNAVRRERLNSDGHAGDYGRDCVDDRDIGAVGVHRRELQLSVAPLGGLLVFRSVLSLLGRRLLFAERFVMGIT